MKKAFKCHKKKYLSRMKHTVRAYDNCIESHPVTASHEEVIM